MSTFRLEIMTPERAFFSGDAEALTVSLPDGLLTVLAGHAPLVTVLTVGAMRFKIDGEWKECFNSEGFMLVRPDKVLVFSQACEYPSEINEHRAKAALERANERMRKLQSLREHEATQVAIARAMNRLRVKSSSNKYNM